MIEWIRTAGLTVPVRRTLSSQSGKSERCSSATWIDLASLPALRERFSPLLSPFLSSACSPWYRRSQPCVHSTCCLLLWRPQRYWEPRSGLGRVSDWTSCRAILFGIEEIFASRREMALAKKLNDGGQLLSTTTPIQYDNTCLQQPFAGLDERLLCRQIAQAGAKKIRYILYRREESGEEDPSERQSSEPIPWADPPEMSKLGRNRCAWPGPFYSILPL